MINSILILKINKLKNIYHLFLELNIFYMLLWIWDIFRLEKLQVKNYFLKNYILQKFCKITKMIKYFFNKY